MCGLDFGLKVRDVRLLPHQPLHAHCEVVNESPTHIAREAMIAGDDLCEIITFEPESDHGLSLLAGTQAIIIESRGGFYSESPASAIGFQQPYLRQLLGFIGITDVTFVHTEKIGLGPRARDAAVTAAKTQLATIARQGVGRAA